MLIRTFGSRSTVGSALELVDKSAADRVDCVDIAFDCAIALTAWQHFRPGISTARDAPER